MTTDEGVRKGKNPPQFNSLTYQGEVMRKDGKPREVKEHLVRIWSDEFIDDELLDRLFGKRQVTWVNRALVRPSCLLRW